MTILHRSGETRVSRFFIAENERALIRLAQIAREDIQLVAILGNRTSRDGYALLFENGDNFLVRQWLQRIFAFDELRDLLFHAGVAHRAARRGLETRREEILHLV